MENMNCVVHYPSETKYSSIIPLNENTLRRINESKLLRENWGGANLHAEQCATVPKDIQPGITGVHLTPCYKKFTMIISQAKKKDKSSRRPRTQREKSSTNKSLFPESCFFCKKVMRKEQGKRVACHKLQTKQAEEKIKKQALAKNDANLLLHVLEVDLIAKKFQMHRSCYRDYTREDKKDDAQSCCDESETFNFDAVKTFIQENVINLNQAVSMERAHLIYRDNHSGDKRYRGKLKKKLQDYFNDSITFVTIDGKTPQVIINSKGLDESTMIKNKDIVIKNAARYIQEDIYKFAKELPEQSWPPSIDELETQNQNIPQSVSQFFETLLKPQSHTSPEKIKLLVQSYSNDVIHSVMRGKVITLKHFLVGLGIHNLTGQKVPIQILSHLGHSLDYNLVCRIETAEAVQAQELSNQGEYLPVRPVREETVLTYFWADNFNMHHDTISGKAVLDITNIVAFQERETLQQISTLPKMSVPREKRRSVQDDSKSIETPLINPKQEPSTFNIPNVDHEMKQEVETANKTLLVWSVLRILASKDQTLPTLSGWLMLMRQKHTGIICKTIETYLPPMATSINDYNTIYNLFIHLQNLAAAVNMPYVNLTMDVGAAMNAYKVLWNFPLKFSNVILHLGDFHLMKENFGIIGKLVIGSGFEDAVFQAGICSSGCLNGILNGSHYNRCWAIHSLMYEALTRLLIESFFNQENTRQKQLPNFNTDETNTLEEILTQDEFQEFAVKFEDFKSNIRNGIHGRTAQFWLMYYLDILQYQHLIHKAVQENDYNLRYYGWKNMLPYFFGLNKTNYARYGSYYVKSLESIDERYPGNQELIKEKGLSVQGQCKHPLRTAIDQRGEQTINRDSKIAGGIKAFSADEKSILKWTLNRASQAENTNALRKFSNIEPDGDVYKEIRPSSIVASEARVQKIVQVLTNEYVNPFDISLCNDELYNLSSGCPVSKDISDKILAIYSNGKAEHIKFIAERLESTKTKFHDSLKRVKLSLFSDSSKKVNIAAKLKTKIVETNRDILGKLLATSAKHERVVDMKKALEFPLTPVPLSLANADGTIRKTQKSELMKIIIQNSSAEFMDAHITLPPKEHVVAYIVDLMALVQTFTSFPENFESLAQRIFASIPKKYKRVDIVADSYLKGIKTSEHNRRGTAPILMVKSVHSKLPADFKRFLCNGQNKIRMIELILEILKRRKEQILNDMESEEVYFSTHNECLHVTKDYVSLIPQLCSNQNEADTKVILHAKHALETHEEGIAIIRSHSGDIDIIVIALSHFIQNADRVILDSNTGKHRKTFRLDQIDMTKEQKLSLIGFHAFTGNDYNSSFFRKGKQLCWKVLESKPKFVNTFCNLGVSDVPSAMVSEELEEYVSLLYGVKNKNVNEARYMIFDNKLSRQNKIIDMALLPPCQQTLKLHILRSHFIARDWRNAHICTSDTGNICNYGWTNTNEPKWVEVIMPKDVEELFLSHSEENYKEDSDDSDFDE